MKTLKSPLVKKEYESEKGQETISSKKFNNLSDYLKEGRDSVTTISDSAAILYKYKENRVTIENESVALAIDGKIIDSVKGNPILGVNQTSIDEEGSIRNIVSLKINLKQLTTTQYVILKDGEQVSETALFYGSGDFRYGTCVIPAHLRDVATGKQDWYLICGEKNLGSLTNFITQKQLEKLNFRCLWSEYPKKLDIYQMNFCFAEIFFTEKNTLLAKIRDSKTGTIELKLGFTTNSGIYWFQAQDLEDGTVKVDGKIFDKKILGLT